MNVRRPAKKPLEMHHDMDAPPYWNVKYKKSLYIDGFAPKNHRVLMQFMLLPSNKGPTVRAWEPEFLDVLAWIESREAPRYPFKIDVKKARQGRVVFEKSCSRCHGTYGKHGEYPEKTIAIAEVGTDPVRLRAISKDHRTWLRKSWMSRYGKDPVVEDPQGYVAPPLNGIWASAPYLHNGSVPTLWHVLHPGQRPKLWRREDGYEQKNVGVTFTEFKELPKSATTPYEKRRYFDTTKFGKSATGHEFPNELSNTEKVLVLEYLKTL
jgi:mono/diheme cytochrome c family protein